MKINSFIIQINVWFEGLILCLFFGRQLNATLELDKQRKILYQKKCFNNPNINGQQQQTLNENHLIEKQIRHLVPGQLIIFGKLDKNNGRSENHLIVKTSGIIRWKASLENFVWNNLGKWSFISQGEENGYTKNLAVCMCVQSKINLRLLLLGGREWIYCVRGFNRKLQIIWLLLMNWLKLVFNWR